MATGETGFDDVTFDLISLQVRDFGGPRRQGAPRAGTTATTAAEGRVILGGAAVYAVNRQDDQV